MNRSNAILLVEDNPSDVDLTRRAFEKCRVANELVVADDGESALEYLFGEGAYSGRDVSQLPALILLDLNLPRLSGFDVLRRIRSDARTRRLLVVIMTSSREEVDIATGYDLGVNSFVRKPVDFKQFTYCVEQLGLYWLVLNEPPPAK